MFDLELFFSAFAVLFVIIDPPGCAPIFATLTRGTSRRHQNVMAFKSVAVATVILVLFAYFGEWVFSKLGISLDALRIAGGIMLFIIGLNMVFEKRTEKREDRAEELLDEIEDPEDIAVFPMGIPMIAGPVTFDSDKRKWKWQCSTAGSDGRTWSGSFNHAFCVSDFRFPHEAHGQDIYQCAYAGSRRSFGDARFTIYSRRY